MSSIGSGVCLRLFSVLRNKTIDFCCFFFCYQYDLSASQFSPDGRVFQVEYANKAVEGSGTVVALRCKDGVAFAVEKIVTSRLYESGSNKRIHNVDKHIGMVRIKRIIFSMLFYLCCIVIQAVAGLLADARQLLTVARDEAKQYKYDYGVSIPVKVCFA